METTADRLQGSTKNSNKPSSFAVLFHVGNAYIFQKMIHEESCADLLTQPNKVLFFSVHSKENRELVLREFSAAHVFIIENRGRDIGGFLHTLSKLFDYERTHNLEFSGVYFFHTKTNHRWRRGLCAPLVSHCTTIEESTEMRSSRPHVFGALQYCYINQNFEKNQTYITDYVKRHDIISLNKLHEYFDSYYSDPEDTTLPTINSHQQLNVNPDFYKAYHCDLQVLKDDFDPVHHWNHAGKNEWSRISNPCYIRHFTTKATYFVAGTIFAASKAFLDLFRNVDLELERYLLEDGDFQHDIERRTHSWEYLFSLMSYLNGGCVVGLSNDDSKAMIPIRPSSHTFQNYKNYYDKNNDPADLLFIKKQCIKIIPWLQAECAIIGVSIRDLPLIIALLQKTQSDYDLYIVPSSSLDKDYFATHKGLCCIPLELNSIIKHIPSKVLMHMNIYLGHKLQRGGYKKVIVFSKEVHDNFLAHNSPELYGELILCNKNNNH